MFKKFISDSIWTTHNASEYVMQLNQRFISVLICIMIYTKKRLLKHRHISSIPNDLSAKWKVTHSTHKTQRPFTPVTHIDGSVHERRNSTANALELCLFCTNPSICFQGLKNFHLSYFQTSHPVHGWERSLTELSRDWLLQICCYVVVYNSTVPLVDLVDTCYWVKITKHDNCNGDLLHVSVYHTATFDIRNP